MPRHFKSEDLPTVFNLQGYPLTDLEFSPPPWTPARLSLALAITRRVIAQLNAEIGAYYANLNRRGPGPYPRYTPNPPASAEVQARQQQMQNNRTNAQRIYCGLIQWVPLVLPGRPIRKWSKRRRTKHKALLEKTPKAADQHPKIAEQYQMPPGVPSPERVHTLRLNLRGRYAPLRVKPETMAHDAILALIQADGIDLDGKLWVDIVRKDDFHEPQISHEQGPTTRIKVRPSWLRFALLHRLVYTGEYLILDFVPQPVASRDPAKLAPRYAVQYVSARINASGRALIEGTGYELPPHVALSGAGPSRGHHGRRSLFQGTLERGPMGDYFLYSSDKPKQLLGRVLREPAGLMLPDLDAWDFARDVLLEDPDTHGVAWDVLNTWGNRSPQRDLPGGAAWWTQNVALGLITSLAPHGSARIRDALKRRDYPTPIDLARLVARTQAHQTLNMRARYDKAVEDEKNHDIDAAIRARVEKKLQASQVLAQAARDATQQEDK